MALLETAREFLKRIGANRHMIKSRPLIIATSVMMIAMPHVFGQSSLTLVGSVPGFSVPLGFAPAPTYSAVNRISLAPGQIVTLQLTGLKTVLPEIGRASCRER